jgi:hypothetical protein
VRAIVAPALIEVFIEVKLRNTPVVRNATRSEQAKKVEFSKMFPGKYFR